MEHTEQCSWVWPDTSLAQADKEPGLKVGLHLCRSDFLNSEMWMVGNMDRAKGCISRQDESQQLSWALHWLMTVVMKG